ncbi:MerR family transcriptional regulator [Jeotgalibacillus marinus]|uniref:MerR family transcriptional regulator n=1 Tax=Jeotgalibacillus marinus TaxID=86667 RepID=A0ABV3Q022_9BACL
MKEASKMIGVPVGTMRQWEADLELTIPRDEIGRYYTDFEVETFNHIKAMRKKSFKNYDKRFA